MTVRVGAVHLGWDVVSVAAGGAGTPIRPVQVEGTYTPPAYLLADSSGRLHTAGVDRQRPDLGMAIADVRDILGHSQIVVAGATWPAELVFRARMYNPLASVGKYLRGKPDVVALPYPDGWPDEKVELYAELVEQLDVTVEPLPESVALSGYVRALGLVLPPDARDPRGIGATGVYSDGRTVLVVAVHGDDEQPTESVDVPVTGEAMRDAHSADNVVIEVMAAARAIGADTSTVLLCGNVCFNDPLRLAFQNHLGHRLRVADHPMHALVLGATHLLVTDGEAVEEEPSGRHVEPAQPVRQDVAPVSRGPVEPQPAPPVQAPPPVQPAPPMGPRGSEPPSAPVVTYGPGYPTTPPEPGDEPTTRVTRGEPPRGLPPNLAEYGSRFTRPPGQPEERSSGPGYPQTGPSPYAPPAGPPAAGPPRDRWAESGAVRPEDEDEQPRKGKRWNKFKDNLFGAHTVVGAVALAVVALSPDADRVELAGSYESVACPLTPRADSEGPQGIVSVRRQGDEPECAQPGVDTLRFVIPGPPDAVDPGPPVQI
ncbi:hypothetical protein [Nocardia bovistercoris]|uniref:hypothetical protein n=1 Tax=Nocardia bovistercoris TaxID=2785916 RepID=UPI001E3C28C2|nr:hypothetical protein [Nocardia bovistercoris]